MRTLIASVAGDLGHEVVAAYETVAEACAGLAQIVADVVIVDGRIELALGSAGPAEGAGIAPVVRALATAAADAPILVLVPLDDRDTATAARAAGAFGVALRPVTHGALTSALAAIASRNERASAT